jgi:hypothetical protein
VIVHDLDFVRVPIQPSKAYAPLVVDPNAVMTGAIATERLESVPGRKPELIQANRGVDLHELSEHDAPQLRRKGADLFAVPEAPCVPVCTTSNHGNDNVWRY